MVYEAVPCSNCIAWNIRHTWIGRTVVWRNFRCDLGMRLKEMRKRTKCEIKKTGLSWDWTQCMPNTNHVSIHSTATIGTKSQSSMFTLSDQSCSHLESLAGQQSCELGSKYNSPLLCMHLTAFQRLWPLYKESSLSYGVDGSSSLRLSGTYRLWLCRSTWTPQAPQRYIADEADISACTAPADENVTSIEIHDIARLFEDRAFHSRWEHCIFIELIILTPLLSYGPVSLW